MRSKAPGFHQGTWQSGQRVQFLSHQTRNSFSTCSQSTLRAVWQTPGHSGVASVYSSHHLSLIALQHSGLMSCGAAAIVFCPCPVFGRFSHLWTWTSASVLFFFSLGHLLDQTPPFPRWLAFAGQISKTSESYLVVIGQDELGCHSRSKQDLNTETWTGMHNYCKK